MTRRLLLALSLVTLCSAPLALYAQGKTVRDRRHRQDRLGHVVDDYGFGREGDDLHHGLDHQVQGEGVGHQVAGGQAHSKHRDRGGRSRECRLQRHVRHAARHPGDGERQGADNEAVNGRGDGSRDVAPATSRAAASGELWVCAHESNAISGPPSTRYIRRSRPDNVRPSDEKLPITDEENVTSPAHCQALR